MSDKERIIEIEHEIEEALESIQKLQGRVEERDKEIDRLNNGFEDIRGEYNKLNDKYIEAVERNTVKDKLWDGIKGLVKEIRG